MQGVTGAGRYPPIDTHTPISPSPTKPNPGGYTLYITGHGDKNYTNELRALPEGQESGQFDVFFRIYVEVHNDK